MDDREPEERLLLVGEVALMKALDELDELSPGIVSENWYQELSRALDLHLKKAIKWVH
jgi:hypothetical protein